LVAALAGIRGEDRKREIIDKNAINFLFIFSYNQLGTLGSLQLLSS
jgi:hypothetical protein